MKKSATFVSPVHLVFVSLVWVVGFGIPTISFSQVPFEQSMNHDLFSKINSERKNNGLQELRYNFVMQNVVDQVAENIKSTFCHCYGDTYITETLYQAGSVDEVIKDLRSWRSRKDNPILKKDVSAITIGVFADDKAYFYVIRTFQSI